MHKSSGTTYIDSKIKGKDKKKDGGQNKGGGGGQGGGASGRRPRGLSLS